MDDEEEDMSRPISHLWEMPFRDLKYDDRATHIGQAGRALATAAAAPTSQGHNNNNNDVDAMPCILQLQPRVPFHSKHAVFSNGARRCGVRFPPSGRRGRRVMNSFRVRAGGGCFSSLELSPQNRQDTSKLCVY